MNSTGTGTIGRIGFWEEPKDNKQYFADSHVTLCRLEQSGLHPKFVSECLSSDWMQNDLERFCFTGSTNQVELSRTSFVKLVIHYPKPDSKEQQKIAKILTTVDNLVEQTQAAIDKYQSIKQGMMQDLFSRGIDPATGQLRPCREEVPALYKETKLGWVPKEWGISTANAVCSAVIDCKNRTPPETVVGCPVVKTNNVKKGLLIEGGLTFTDAGSYQIWTERGKPTPGDVLITREAPVGEVCMIPAHIDNACLGQRMMMYKPNMDIVNNEFLLFQLMSEKIQKRLIELAGGSTVGHVKVGDIRDLRLLVPKLTEQEAIASKLKSITNISDSLKIELKKNKKIKKALMQDLLTGKVRVNVQ